MMKHKHLLLLFLVLFPLLLLTAWAAQPRTGGRP
jgi:hypothetical protein